MVRFGGILLALACACLSSEAARAAKLTPGNIIVSEWVAAPYHVYEYTPGGSLVQTFTVTGATDSLRKAVVDPSGNIEIYDGTFSPSLATLNPVTGAVTYHQGLGFSTVNNITFGGVAAFGPYVYVSDMDTNGSSGKGILRFNTTDWSSQAFAASTEYTRVQMGLNGLLYAITGSAGNASAFDEFNPSTMQLIRRISVPDDIRGIAVAQNGDIYASDWGNILRHYDSSGNLLDSKAAPSVGYDIDLSSAGMVVASAWGSMSVTDTTFGTISKFDTGIGWPAFVSFVPAPEPSTLAIAGAGCMVLLRRGRGRYDSATSALV